MLGGPTLRNAALVLLIGVVVGCGPPSSRPSAEITTTPLVWPEPPAQPRIRFVKIVARPEDLGVRPSFWQRLGRLIVGAPEEWMIRPTAVVANGPVLFVADPGAQALWAIDAQRGRFRKTSKADAQPLVSPVAVAVGRNDRLYVADSFLAKVFVYNQELILKTAIVDARLRRPAGLAFDETSDRLYVADSAAHRIWIYSSDGRPGGAIGERGTGDGEFNFPTHVAVDRAGMVYVTDSLGFRVQMFDGDGHFVGQFGRHGDSSGDFASPKGIAVDPEGHVYVVEALFDAVQIFDRHGRFLLSFGERGLGPGRFWLPVGISIDAQARIYVADAYNQRVQVFQYLGGNDD